MSENAHSQQVSKRPAWVWIISALFLISAGYTIFSHTLIYSGSIPLTPLQKDYFASLTLFDYAVVLGTAILNVAGAILLFLLKRPAPFLFLSAFALGAVGFAYHILAKNWLSAIGVPGLVGAVIGQLLIILVIAYAFNLRKRGILR